MYKPAGSTAVFSGSTTAASPGSFTVDQEGPYLVRLITDAGLNTESVQYVRLRYLTEYLQLKLVAAGEGYGGAVPVPVDQTPTGWTDALNENLLSLLSASGQVTPSERVYFVDPAPGQGDFQILQEAIDAAQATATVNTPWTIFVQPGTYTENVTFAPFVNVIGVPNRTIIQGRCVLDLPGIADFCFLSDMTLTNLISSTDPVLLLSGSGTGQLTHMILQQLGISGTQGAALRMDGGTFTLLHCDISSSSSLPGTHECVQVVQGNMTFDSGLIRGNNSLAFTESSYTSVRFSSLFGDVSGTGNLTLEYSRIEGFLSVNPTGVAVSDNITISLFASQITDTCLFNVTGVSGVATLRTGAVAVAWGYTFTGGYPVLETLVRADSLSYDATVSGLAATDVQAALDEVAALAQNMENLEDAYQGGRTIIADAGAVQVLNLSPADPPEVGDTNGMVEVSQGVLIGALEYPEIALKANPYGWGAQILMGNRVVPTNAPWGAGTVALQANATENPLYRNYNLRVQTTSAEGGGAIGRLIVQGGDGLPGGTTPDGGPIYIQAGSCFDAGSAAASLYLSPGYGVSGSGWIYLADPDSSTPATLTAAAACSNPVGVTGSITFATNMGSITCDIAASDSMIAAVNKLNALPGISASQMGGVITLTTDHLGATAEIYFLYATAGLDAALGGFDGQPQVDGTYGSTVGIRGTADGTLSVNSGVQLAPVGSLTAATDGVLFVGDSSLIDGALYYTQPGGSAIGLSHGLCGTREVSFADSPVSILGYEEVLLVDTTAGDVTVQLPDLSLWPTKQLVVKNNTGVGHDVFVLPFAGQDIDGGVSLTLSGRQYKRLAFPLSGTTVAVIG